MKKQESSLLNAKTSTSAFGKFVDSSMEVLFGGEKWRNFLNSKEKKNKLNRVVLRKTNGVVSAGNFLGKMEFLNVQSEGEESIKRKITAICKFLHAKTRVSYANMIFIISENSNRGILEEERFHIFLLEIGSLEDQQSSHSKRKDSGRVCPVRIKSQYRGIQNQ